MYIHIEYGASAPYHRMAAQKRKKDRELLVSLGAINIHENKQVESDIVLSTLHDTSDIIENIESNDSNNSGNKYENETGTDGIIKTPSIHNTSNNNMNSIKKNSSGNIDTANKTHINTHTHSNTNSNMHKTSSNNINIKDENTILVENENDDEDIEHFLETSADLLKNTPLLWATVKGHLRAVWLLLLDGYSPNDRDHLGEKNTLEIV